MYEGCQFLFTVFTPTYNRAHTLPRVYDSLCQQTCLDFEWLIVDDGSRDHTLDLVSDWMNSAPFPIRYYYQDNGGKHRAINYGVKEARGYFFLIIDSDDQLVPEALALLQAGWLNIPAEQRDGYSGVTGLCINQDGRLVGSRFPTDQWLDSNSIEIRAKYGVTGEKFGFQRIDCLRAFPFPEIEGEKYLALAIVWNRLAKWKTRYINEVLRVYYEMQQDSLTGASARLRSRNPRGARMYYQEYLGLVGAGFNKDYLRNLINYIRFSFHADISLAHIPPATPAPWATFLIMPIGYLFYRVDKKRIG